MSQTAICRGRATAVKRDNDGTLRITYHNTDVVSVDREGRVTLDSGNYRTYTTKLRMNQAANQFNLGYQIQQRDFEWWVVLQDSAGTCAVNSPIKFRDGMRLSK
jgi:hypothetical protein